MRTAILLTALTSALSTDLTAQETPAYSRSNTLTPFVEYSNTSSHLILGTTRNRHIAALGATYSRRLLHFSFVDWFYDAEFRPLAYIADPTESITVLTIDGVAPIQGASDPSHPIARSCQSGDHQITIPFQPPIVETYHVDCGQRWTYSGGISPLGQRLNFGTRHRLQPFVEGNGGFLASTRDLPYEYTSRFNFTFEFGAGLQWYRDHHHAWSAEYRIHHLSNAYIGISNPGIDSQILKVGYSFGR